VRTHRTTVRSRPSGYPRTSACPRGPTARSCLQDGERWAVSDPLTIQDDGLIGTVTEVSDLDHQVPVDLICCKEPLVTQQLRRYANRSRCVAGTAGTEVARDAFATLSDECVESVHPAPSALRSARVARSSALRRRQGRDAKRMAWFQSAGHTSRSTSSKSSAGTRRVSCTTRTRLGASAHQSVRRSGRLLDGATFARMVEWQTESGWWSEYRRRGSPLWRSCLLTDSTVVFTCGVVSSTGGQ
jgi:hypothetical protein